MNKLYVVNNDGPPRKSARVALIDLFTNINFMKFVYWYNPDPIHRYDITVHFLCSICVYVCLYCVMCVCATVNKSTSSKLKLIDPS